MPEFKRVMVAMPDGSTRPPTREIDQAASNRGEYGWDGTAGTIFWVDPARQLITILMTQSSPANPDQVRQRFKAAVESVQP